MDPLCVCAAFTVHDMPTVETALTNQTRPLLDRFTVARCQYSQYWKLVPLDVAVLKRSFHALHVAAVQSRLGTQQLAYF